VLALWMTVEAIVAFFNIPSVFGAKDKQSAVPNAV